MSIFSLLGLRKGATEEEVRTRYLRKLIKIHPDRNKGNSAEYTKLRDEYEKYIRGESFEGDPYLVCNRAKAESVICRCGGKYKIHQEIDGRVECEFCSCFIEIEELLGLTDATRKAH
ncbi:hypothetical protein KMI_07g12550 [Encephalitozoon hellem]|uniref:DnaJ domain-containing protein n=1 Tax=Encephalitozoon hellem TaxID=27973 RepID=A0A9Q9CBL0_ENCHE|nr:uncharacterized protein EHEL_031430 [Encephalitozoon hellem ATCC 50504]AFM98038.1 hypothetical protein EHEL_031430 [Encephalitozoon hellem ATCC 50504]KAG5859411.1 hypothetical protein KMI_07g12550 [Encephalitozoon hellem]UTX42843.1 DnaJ domain-containing protein [Encephalitozoon hellem]WEL38302.1 DnaJ domain-containing protein [Encephalitozoon hellem]|eukprot:XP_003887019.1 hypothetical protein EHEL_031430 [Encephalitozoon hellem ATCC 50504]